MCALPRTENKNVVIILVGDVVFVVGFQCVEWYFLRVVVFVIIAIVSTYGPSCFFFVLAWRTLQSVQPLDECLLVVLLLR